MRALSNLITVNDPDLVLFVGEALVRRPALSAVELYRGPHVGSAAVSRAAGASALLLPNSEANSQCDDTAIASWSLPHTLDYTDHPFRWSTATGLHRAR